MITLIIFTILIINCFPANCVSTIKVGDQLNDTSQLVSPGKIFTLGFFTIPATTYTYLGIWYTNDDRSRRVWVANPFMAITSSSHVLMIHPTTCNLIIAGRETILINISDIQSAHRPNLTATLEDNGNFRLKNETDNRILWQSFDHPSNVLLPDMKLGSDLRTGQSWNLTSWLSDKIPYFGTFTLSWEPNGENSQRLLIRQREDIRQQGQPYWTSGDLSNQTFEFMGVNNPFSKYQYNLSYVYNNEERYLSFHSINGVQPMWILTPQGQILDGDSSESTPDFCYGYDSGNGCVANSNLPKCRSEDDKFSLLNGDFSPSLTSNSFDGNLYQSVGDCMVRCWKDCGCLGFTTHGNGTGCVIWTGTKSINNFSINPQGNSVLKYVLVSPNPSKVYSYFTFKAMVLIVEERQQRDDECLLELMASESFNDATNIESNGKKGSELMMFNFSFIVAATNDFASENKLGEGGFGSVYKDF